MTRFISTTATPEGVVKKFVHDPATPGVALHIPCADGHKIIVPLTEHLQCMGPTTDVVPSHLTLAILPLARLPGHVGMHDVPRGALLRPGRLYIFREGVLWREQVCDGKGNLFEVDLPHWRKQAELGLPADNRPGIGLPRATLQLPIKLNGRMVAEDLLVAYSETPWSWQYICEFNVTRGAKYRSQKISPAWAAAVRTEYPWRTAQETPAILIDGYATGFRPRDFNIETLLEDPATFTPDLAGFPDDSLFSQLHQRQTELALAEGEPAPDPMPAFEAHPNILVEKKLYGLPKLAALLIHDPVFDARHAAAQIRLAQQQLQTLNALVSHHPHGHYARLLYKTLMAPAPNPMAEHGYAIEEASLTSAVMEGERAKARKHMALHLTRLMRIVDTKLPKIFEDWHSAPDERMLEPYALLGELLTALGTLPVQSDALCMEAEAEAFGDPLYKLVGQIMSGEHSISAHLFDTHDEDKPQLERLQALINQTREVDPDNLDISSLTLAASASLERGNTDPGLAYKNVHGVVDELLNGFAMSMVAQISRLGSSVVKVDFHRLFSPTFNLLQKLSPQWHGIEFIPRGEALARNYVILGVEGGGLKYGLLPEEVNHAKRMSVKYVSMKNLERITVASTSPKVVPDSPNLGNGHVLAAPAEHPSVEKIRAWKLRIFQPVQGVVSSRAFPAVGVIAALYNLTVQIDAMQALSRDGGDGQIRALIGSGSALIDLTVALGNLSKPLLGERNPFVTSLQKGSLDVSWISKRWAANLERQSGNPKLPILRALNGGAMFLTSILSAWDSVRSARQGDTDAAVAFGVAAGAGLVMGACMLSIVIVPAVLIVSSLIFIGASVVAAWLTDPALLVLIKNAPFGRNRHRDEQFDYLDDGTVAYHQLLGLLSRPRLQVSRVKEWLELAPRGHGLMLEAAARQRNNDLIYEEGYRLPAKPITEEDWVVTVTSPLLSMCRLSGSPQLWAEERESLIALERHAFTSVNRKVIYHSKVERLALDADALLWVFPSIYPRTAITFRQRMDHRCSHALKIKLQFFLGHQPRQTLHDLALPQPNPKYWHAYTPDDAKIPASNASEAKAPYWLIHDEEFKL